MRSGEEIEDAVYAASCRNDHWVLAPGGHLTGPVNLERARELVEDGGKILKTAEDYER